MVSRRFPERTNPQKHVQPVDARSRPFFGRLSVGVPGARPQPAAPALRTCREAEAEAESRAFKGSRVRVVVDNSGFIQPLL